MPFAALAEFAGARYAVVDKKFAREEQDKLDSKRNCARQ
jgi:hypothetical protein